MRCPSPERLAAALDDHDLVVASHVTECVACRCVLADQRAIRELVRRAARPPLSPARRALIASEVMAHADHAGPSFLRRGLRKPSRPWRWSIAAVVASAAAVLVAVIGLRTHVTAESPVAPSRARDELALHVTGTSHEIAPDAPVNPAASPPAPKREAVARSPRTTLAELGGTEALTRETTTVADVVALREGALTVDARSSRPITVVTRDTTIEIRGARATVIAHAGAIGSVAVFAGSVEITTGGHRQIVETGGAWTPAPTGPAVPTGPTPPTPAAAMVAFRDGWAALRLHRHADAIAAFDRATDPVVVEDATFWGAIAAERGHVIDANGHRDAVRRFTNFLTQFPSSPRAAAARDHLAQLTRTP